MKLSCVLFPKGGVLIAFSGMWLLAGCGGKKEEAPPPPTSLGNLANQLAGKTNTPPPPPKEEPRKSTEEILSMVAGQKAASTTVTNRTFIDGLLDKAKTGDAESMYWLGFYYSTGKDVAKDLEKGAKWYLEAAEHNHDKAQYELGVAFEEGLGLPKDPVAAYQWYYLAAQKGHLDAIERRDKLAAAIPEFEVEKGRRAAELFVPK